MDNYNIITPSSKFKHLSFEHYEYIIREITKHDAFHHGKKRNTGRTALIRSLASDVGTSVSNVYSIINDASISILDSNLISHKELSSLPLFTSVRSCVKFLMFLNLIKRKILSIWL